jgi:hypothetical protein
MDDTPDEADLDATVDLIAFMWLATGRDPEAVTPEARTALRAMLTQHFGRLPPDLQALFANGRSTDAAIRGEWHASDPPAQAAIAQQFDVLLALCGMDVGAGTTWASAGSPARATANEGAS